MPQQSAGRRSEIGAALGENAWKNREKTLNRGNEAKGLLETQGLAVFGAKNELKTNSILSTKRGRIGNRYQVSGARSAVAREYNPLTLLPPWTGSRECGKRDKKPAMGQAAQRIKRHPGTWFYFSTLDFRPLDFEKLNEQSGNVYENKGPLWKSAREAGMLLIIKVLIR